MRECAGKSSIASGKPSSFNGTGKLMSRKGVIAAVAACLLLVYIMITSGRVATAGGSRRAMPQPAVKTLANGQEVLAPAVQRALAQSFPGFHQVGDVVTGDFDGNGRQDSACYLTNRRRGVPLSQSTWLLVAFHQLPSGEFQPYVIGRRRDPSTVIEPDTRQPSRFNDYGLTDLGQGAEFPVVAGGRRERQLELPHDGIIESHNRFRVWYFQGGKYHGVWAVGDFAE
jgi:hypothetical protein